MFGGEPQPHIFVRNSIIDLGTIRSSDKPKRISFEIENTGEALLKISKVHGSCPCFDLDLDRSAVTPGQKARLLATVRAPPKPGQWRDTILVCSNDPMNPIARLEFKAHVELSCMVLPSPVVVENLDYGEVREVALEIMGPSDDDSFRVPGVSAAIDAIRMAGLKELAVPHQAGRNKRRASILVERREMPVWKEKLTISTSDPTDPELRVLLKVSETPLLRIVPSTVCLRCSSEDPRPTATIEITSNHTSIRGKISDIVSPRWLKVTNDADSEHGPVRLLLSILPEFLPNRSAISGRIKANLGQNEIPIDVPVLAFAQE